MLLIIEESYTNFNLRWMIIKKFATSKSLVKTQKIFLQMQGCLAENFSVLAAQCVMGLMSF